MPAMAAIPPSKSLTPVMVMVSPSASVSFSSNLAKVTLPGFVDTSMLSTPATGASFTASMLTVTVAGSDTAFLSSVAIYLKVPGPEALATGVNKKVAPSRSIVASMAEPVALSTMTEKVIGSPSTSVAEKVPSMEVVISSTPIIDISSATGASLTALTVTVTVAGAESNSPSLAMYWKESSPLKLSSGV